VPQGTAAEKLLVQAMLLDPLHLSPSMCLTVNL
jgi:hypothetical protein